VCHSDQEIQALARSLIASAAEGRNVSEKDALRLAYAVLVHEPIHAALGVIRALRSGEHVCSHALRLAGSIIYFDRGCIDDGKKKGAE
jgi:hypothetical protein